MRSLHGDERAQVSFLGLVGAFALIGMLAMVMNTGDTLRQRMEMQAAADVTAISAATWTARGMNTVAMINVLNTKLLSMAAITNSAYKTVNVMIPIAQGQDIAFTACSGVPIVGAFCVAMKIVVRIQLTVLETVLEPMLKALHNNVTRCPKAAWTVMKSLSTAAEVVAVSFPKIGYAQGIAIARSNNVNGWVVEGSALQLGAANLSEFARLPVSRDNAALNDFCTPMLDGGKGFELQGYESDEGPAKHGKGLWDTGFIAFVNLFPHPIFAGFFNAELQWMQCGSVAEPEGTEVDFYHLDDCRQHGAEAKWTRFNDQTDWLPHNHWRPENFIAWVPAGGGSGGLSSSEQAGFGGLEDLGGGPVSIPSGAITHRPTNEGVAALTGQSRGRNWTVQCSSSANSGYPRINSTNLKNHPNYMHFEVGEDGFHRRAATSRREATGTYFLKVTTETRYRGDVPFDDNDDGVTDRTEELIYSDSQYNAPAPVAQFFSPPLTAEMKAFLNPEYQYKLEAISLTSAGKQTLQGQSLKDYLEEEYGANTSQGNSHGGGQCGSYPIPHLLVDEDSTPDKLRYFAVVSRELAGDKRPFWTDYFRQVSGQNTIYAPNGKRGSDTVTFRGFAQAQVYNELSADTFTQDWRVRLERASLLQSALDRGNELGLGFLTGPIGQVLDTVNNH